MDDMDAAPLAMDTVSVDGLIFGNIAFAPNSPSAPEGARVVVPLDRETFVRGLAMAVAGFAFNHAPDRIDMEAERIAKRIAAFIDKGRG